MADRDTVTICLVSIWFVGNNQSGYFGILWIMGKRLKGIGSTLLIGGA